MAESEEELKSLLMKEEHEKAGLKLNIQKTKIMASGLITSRQIDGEVMETVRDFIFMAPELLQMVIPWRRKWQPTPVFLPGEFHGRRSLAGYSPQGR